MYSNAQVLFKIHAKSKEIDCRRKVADTREKESASLRKPAALLGRMGKGWRQMFEMFGVLLTALRASAN